MQAGDAQGPAVSLGYRAVVESEAGILSSVGPRRPGGEGAPPPQLPGSPVGGSLYPAC